MSRLLFLLLLVLLLPLAGCGGDAETAPGPEPENADAGADRLIDPAGSVGAITPETTEADLAAHYGAEAVDSVQVDVGEGMFVPGTRLFAGTPDAVTIEWKEGGSGPRRITIAEAGTSWRTAGGLTIGTPLEEVERLNDGPFLLTGFEWDYPGRTVSWEDGALPEALQLAFRPTREVAPEAFTEVLGDVRLRSDHPVVQEMGLVVEQVFVRW